MASLSAAYLEEGVSNGTIEPKIEAPAVEEDQPTSIFLRVIKNFSTVW